MNRPYDPASLSLTKRALLVCLDLKAELGFYRLVFAPRNAKIIFAPAVPTSDLDFSHFDPALELKIFTLRTTHFRQIAQCLLPVACSYTGNGLSLHI